MNLGHFTEEKHGKEGARVKNMAVAWLKEAEKNPSSVYRPITRQELINVIAWITALEQRREHKLVNRNS